MPPELPPELPEDLRRFLNQATMFHPARIWAKASFTYETKISYRKGVVLGGAYSPFFLQDREGVPRLGWSDVGGTSLARSRIILADIVPESANLNEWLVFLQLASKEREGVLIAVDSFQHEEILSTLLINNLKNVVQVVVVTHSRFAGIKKLPTTTMPYLNRLQSPLASSVWIRKDSSILFQDRSEENPLPTVECAVIEVGGKDAAEIKLRVQMMNAAITEMIEIER